MAKKQWRETEVNTLTQNWPKYQEGQLDKRDLKKLFRGRTFTAIHFKARTLNGKKTHVQFVAPKTITVLEGNQLVKYVQEV